MAKPKNSKNKSRTLDVVDSPEYQRDVQMIRDRWRADFQTFCEQKLKIVDKSATGNPIIPFKFNQCQLRLLDLIEKIGDFQELRSTELNQRDPRVQITRLPVEIVVLKARKVGVSTFLEARG